MKELTLYTTATCPWCGKLKNYLKEKGAEFQEVDISVDETGASEMVELTGQRSVPVLSKGDQYVVGFNPTEVDRLLH